MISNPDRTILISSMGWVDRDALWLYDVGAGRHEAISLGSGARYVSLHSNGTSRFSVAHHFDGKRFEVTVREFSAPSKVVARAWVEENGQGLSGDASAWSDVPRFYVASLAFVPWRDFVLVRVAPSENAVRVQRLQWYDERYDKGYQGVIDVLELPGESVALVSVQRSSRLILHDLETGAARRYIALCDRGGNPRLELRESGEQIWASDYDMLVVLKRADWSIVQKVRLERASSGTQQFIGDFSFVPDTELCAVARPFSGDVVGLDTVGLKIKRVAKLGGQPLEVATLAGGEVVARDWKTGSLLKDRLERRWFAG